jgi:ribonuclease HI
MPPREHLVYTDGSCKPGPEGQRPGGWGYVVKSPTGAVVEGCGSAADTHAKVMEVRAVAEALATLPDGAHARVFSDNQGLVATLQGKLANYRRSGFANVDPLVVEHLRAIDASVTGRGLRVAFQWVRAHNGNAGNERADALAAQGARDARAARDTPRGAPDRG